MQVAIVRFPLGETMSLERAKELYSGYSVKYRNVAGLLTKYYVYGPDKRGGAVYIWESREHAEAQYTPEWYASMTQRWGVRPEVELLESPVVVDNRVPEG